MNVYDFDKTIYKYDSSIRFYLFCLKKKPSIVRILPKQIFSTFLYFIKIKKKREWKEDFFSFLKFLTPKKIERILSEFWDKEIKNINHWYFYLQKKSDVIISASPKFLLIPIAKKLGDIYLIATDVDVSNGKLLSENCYGEAKVRFFRKEFDDDIIENFYSDSVSDTPMAKLAQKAYLVKNQELIPWDSSLV